MNRCFVCILSALALAAASLSASAQDADRKAAEQLFEAKIRPLFAARCFECHRDASKGGLTIGSRESLLRGGGSGAAIVSGDPDASLLIQAVSRTHKRLKMPPGKPLEAREILALRQWVKAGAVWPESPRDFFRRKIQPVLVAKCLSCHREKPKGKLRLDTRAGLLTGGGRGPAIVPGAPEKSLLLHAIRHHGDAPEMPPKEKDRLSDKVVADFSKWIAEGAAWDDSPIGPDSSGITAEQRAFWSFQPVTRSPVPQNADASAEWRRNPIDAFVRSRQREHSLTPGKTADARTLIRRATYDLLGLPPSPAEVAKFVPAFQRDPDAAWHDLIERLLASRHYGERWGRHWLDIVRYADTAGDAGDFPIPEAYKYRNYIIDSFNKDKPYDQFVREQIAGDQLSFEDDDQRWEQTVATGYLAISRRVGVSPQNLKHLVIEDTLNNLGKTFLGLTIGCARCHDHKFDPIPTADYYSLYGIFDSSVYPHPGAEHKPWRQDFVYRIGNEEAAELLREKRRVLEDWNRKERAVFELYRDFQRKPPSELTGTRESAWKVVLATREARRPHAESFPDLEIAFGILDGSPHDVSIQEQGDPRSAGPVVRRGFLQILGGQKLSDDAKGSGRRELAEWLTDPKNPLTARVMVNRIWHYHFGRGLVRTTSDFGVRGERPTHPKLLDFLAAEFVANGWSIKQMHRLIMKSQTYRLASQDLAANSKVDPDNRFLWRANRQRLDAEQIRDSILAFSGELDLSPGGRHSFGHHLTYFYRQHEPFQESYPTNRRSVYMMQQRIQKNPYLDLFDGPDGNVSLAERNATTTTLQALFLMNSEFMHEQSSVLARRLIAEADGTSERVQWAYQLIFGRAATSSEVDRAEAYFARIQKPRGPSSESEAWSGYLRTMLSGNEFLYVE
jgi:mono/diheme cytochrome c family protein